MDMAKLLNKLSNPEHYEKLLSLLQDQDFFNPDNYTEENNPMLASLIGSLSVSTDWSETSSASRKLSKEHRPTYEKFTESLNKEQRDLFVDLEFNEMIEAGLMHNEGFIKGFKLAVSLIVSGLVC